MSPTVTTGSVGMNPPHYYFVKVVNISTSRDVVITHVWFVKADADVPVTNGTDPLPVRLRPDEGWEGWVNVVDLDDKPDAAFRCRARLSNGTIVKSRPDWEIPSTGTLGGRRRS